MLVVLVGFVFLGTFLVAAFAVCIAALVKNKRAPEPDVESSVLLSQELSSTVPVWRQLLDRFNLTAALKRRIAEAGLRWAVGRVTIAMLFLGSVGFAIFFNSAWAPLGVAFAAAWAFGSIPYWIIGSKRKKRLAAMEAQFPDALEAMARSMRAGHALAGAIAMLGSEVPAPLGPEFRKAGDEHRLGLPWENVLQNLALRVPTAEVRLFVAAFLVQTRTGGKLTEVLERLAETIRESSSPRGEVRAISAQGRMTGTILTALPLVIGLAMLITNPGYIGLLFSNPTGNTLVWCSAGCLVAGHLLIRHIVDVKAP